MRDRGLDPQILKRTQTSFQRPVDASARAARKAGFLVDTQTIEILGRNRLVDELLMAGLEVALPLRDRGVDLIAYVELPSVASKFIAVPIQMRAASTRAFSLDAKYAKVSNLVMAYVWGLRAPEHASTLH